MIPNVNVFKKYWGLSLVAVILVVILGFTGNSGYKYVKSIIQKERDINKEQMEESARIIDSLTILSGNQRQEAEEYKVLWEQAEWRNNRKFNKLKERIYETSISNDTSFTNNARIISNTVTGQLKDSI